MKASKKFRKLKLFEPILFVGAFFILFFLFSPAKSAQAATQIYRSVGPGSANEIASGTVSKLLTINGSGSATFSGTTIPDNVGVGDVIIYDSDDSDTLTAADDIVFIHGRSSSTAYTVKTSAGANTATTTTGNDTWAIYRAYTSLANAEAGTENTSIGINFDAWTDGKDLVSANEVWNIACYGDATDTTGVTIKDWSTATSTYIKIYTPYLSSEVGASQRHSGKWDSAKYNIIPSTINVNPFDVYVSYTRFEGLQVRLEIVPTAYTYGFWIESGGEIDIRNTIIRGPDAVGTDYHGGIRITSASTTKDYLSNSIIYDFPGSYGYGLALANGYGDFYVSNVTIFNCDYGFWNASDSTKLKLIVKNSIAQETSDGFVDILASSSAYNISDLAGDAPDSNSKNSTAVSFISTSTDDFHLSPSDTAARNAGTDLSADAVLPFSNDIDGQTRSGAWDIGADEYLDITAPTISSIASSTTAFTATITWTTNENATSTVNYGLTSAYGSASSSDAFASTTHSITLHNLSATTTYHFQITVRDAAGNISTSSDRYFITAEAASAKQIYRSVGVGGTNEIASSTGGGTLTIDASGNLTFSGTTMPNRVGVGDAIVYDSDDDNDIDASDAVVFIHARTSNTAYTAMNQSGTTTAITTSGNDTWAVYRAYTSLANAESSTNNTSILPSYDTWSGGKNIAANATGTNEVWNIACYGDGADGIATFNGWTTSPQNYLKVYTPYLSSEVGESQRHNGVWDNSKYRITSATDSILSSVNYMKIEGIQGEHSNGVGDDDSPIHFSNVIGSSTIYIYDNILKQTNKQEENDWHIGINISGNVSNVDAYVWNNIVYGFNGNVSHAGITLHGAHNGYFYNNTVYGGRNGYQCFRFESNSNIYLKNNIAQGCQDDYYSWSSNLASVINNAYSQGTDPGSSGLDISAYASTTIFVDPANDDFHLKAGSPVIGMGANLSADSFLPFSNDIDGQTRSSAWDIGADEYLDITAPSISSIASSTTIFTATITWTTNENATSTVNYGLTSAYGSASSSDAFASSSPSHSITLRNLASSTTYHFQISSTDASGNRATSSDYTFTTLTPTYTITASSGANGTVTPSGATTKNYGESQAYTIATSTAGYHVADILVDSVSVGTSSLTYTFTNIRANHTISATFSANPISTYTIGGTISGLSGTVVLQNNSGDNLSVSSAGSFTFAAALNNSASYAVTVLTNPSGQTCTVSSGSGTVSGANVTSVSVSCANNSNNNGGGGTSSGGRIDNTAPAAPTNFKASSSNNTVILSWANPTDSDFAGVKIYRKANSAPADRADNLAKLIYQGKDKIFIDNSSDSGLFYYSLYSYDDWINYSAPASLFSFKGISGGAAAEISKTIVNDKKITSPSGLSAAVAEKIIAEEAKQLAGKNQAPKLAKNEQALYLKIISAATKSFTQKNKNIIADFIKNGTPTTKNLGASERADCLMSFKNAFGYLPKTESDWQEILRIANGRPPIKQNKEAVRLAKVSFKTIYGRNFDAKNSRENKAIMMMAYGLRSEKRDLNKEKEALKIYQKVFKKFPAAIRSWNAVRAIAYSGIK